MFNTKGFREMYGDKIELRERLFRIIISMGMVAILITIICNLYVKADTVIILFQTLGFFVMGIILYASYKYHKYKVAAILVAVLFVLVFFPILFLTSGAVESGSSSWFVIGIIFLFLLFEGKTLGILLTLTLIEYCAVYYVAYLRPDLIIPMSSVADVYFDSLVSMIIVSLIVGFTTKFQISVCQRERAKSEAQKDKIEKISDSKSAFFANMSHEIRTPINTIIGLNEMTLRENVSDEIAENAVNIQNASKMLLSLINDILDLSKIESGKMEIVPVRYETGAMFSELVNMIWIRAHEKKLEFKLNIAVDIPSMLYGDEVRIKQILINILTNAVKYTKEGSITLNAKCERINANRVRLIISVTDTGMGIRKENIEDLFSSFKRVDEKKNSKIEGTGLGLSITKQLLDLMGGKIEVDSIYTKGTTFTITLEQQIMDLKPIGEIDFIARRKQNKRGTYHQQFEAPDANILIVDDNEMNLMVARKLLRSTQVQIDTASSGKECLEKTKTKSYHVIFMDHKMPEMDGVETLQHIRAQENGRCQQTPVIALTANALSGAEQIYRDYGFQSYLAKPINGTLFESVLLRYLPQELIEYRKSEKNETEEFMKDGLQISAVSQKKPLCITTDCVSDIPEEWMEKLNIKCMYYYVITKQGKFSDMSEVSTENLLEYMEEGTQQVRSEHASVEEYESFFADALSNAEKVIHISMAKNASDGYKTAQMASKGFDHVNIFDSGHLSSGMGIIVLYAAQMVQDHRSMEDILKRLEMLKNQVSTSFVVPNPKSMYQVGRLGKISYQMCNALSVCPVLCMSQSRIKVKEILFGSTQVVYRKYISRQLRFQKNIDKSILFITGAGISIKAQQEIEAEVRKYIAFDRIVFQKASATITSNCGAGCLGLLYMRKG